MPFCMYLLIRFFCSFTPPICLNCKNFITIKAEDNHTKNDSRLFERQPSFSSCGGTNEEQRQGEAYFSGQLGLTLGQLRLRPEASRCSTSETDVFKTVEKPPSTGPSGGMLPVTFRPPGFTRNSHSGNGPLVIM